MPAGYALFCLYWKKRKGIAALFLAGFIEVQCISTAEFIMCFRDINKVSFILFHAPMNIVGAKFSEMSSETNWAYKSVGTSETCVFGFMQTPALFSYHRSHLEELPLNIQMHVEIIFFKIWFCSLFFWQQSVYFFWLLELRFDDAAAETQHKWDVVFRLHDWIPFIWSASLIQPHSGVKALVAVRQRACWMLSSAVQEACSYLQLFTTNSVIF